MCQQYSGVGKIYAKASEMLSSAPDEITGRNVSQNLEAEFRIELPFATAASAIIKRGAQALNEAERSQRRQQLCCPSVCM
jgi:hypothetical protein